jgi:hypothetical protein
MPTLLADAHPNLAPKRLELVNVAAAVIVPVLKDKRLGGLRVCVLKGREARVSPEHWSQCTDSKHSHVDVRMAEDMVARGLWEWVTREESGKRRKAMVGMQRAVRVLSGRHWKKTLCRDSFSSVAVMQFVPGG